jgi:thiol-disulfide isomerase/thioredoxin
MSETAYSKTRRVRKGSYNESPIETEQYAEDDGYEEYDEYDEDGDYDEPSGLFSTPARAVTMVASIIVLLFVAGSIAWLLGQKAKEGNQQGIGGVQPINPGIKAVPSAPKVGALAPDFTLNNVSNNTPLKLSGLRGKPVLVNFWGTWCPPCRAEMPELEKLYSKYKDQVDFVGVSMGPRDEPAGVDQFVKLNKYSWTFIHDTDSSVSINYQVQGIPSTFFVDKTGIIRSIHVGGADAATLENGLQTAEKAQ